jgi:hypothetical protein
LKDLLWELRERLRRVDADRSSFRLPGEFGGEEFVDQVLVERFKSLDIRRSMTLGIKVVGVELAYPLKPEAVAVVHQVGVLSLAMRRVEGMVTDHGEGLVREIILDDVKEILIVPP